VLGEITREEFMIKFTGAGKVYMHHFQDFLFATYERKSFPETFFHPQIAQALCATGKLSDPNTIQQRITETGAIMVASLDKKKGLGIMLGLAKSHERRNQNLYNEDTVEFTLLTFSYYGAKAAAITEEEWFFYRKVVGSMLGLPPGRLHNNKTEAQLRMQALHKACPWPPNQHSQRLLDTFVTVYLPEEDDVRDACQGGLISKRMQQYLELKGRWPANLARPRPDQ